jgi:hypothetical protein
MTDFLLLVLAPNLPKVTAVVGLWGWTAVSVAVGSLIMFYRCRYCHVLSLIHFNFIALWMV